MTTTNTTPINTPFLKKHDVVALTGMCYTSIWNLEKKGSFPARKQLSPGRVAWLRSDVDAWVNNLACAPTPGCRV